MSTLDKIIALLGGTFGVSRERLKPETCIDQLELDSLPAIALLHEIETEFNITLPRVLAADKTLQGLADDIDAHR